MEKEHTMHNFENICCFLAAEMAYAEEVCFRHDPFQCA